MLTLRGVFYPTGYRNHDVMLVEPDAILDQIGRTAPCSDSPLPSVGAEVATVHEYEELAMHGNCGVLVHAPSSKDTEFVMDVVHTRPFTCAQKYRPLVIEDMH